MKPVARKIAALAAIGLLCLPGCFGNTGEDNDRSSEREKPAETVKPKLQSELERDLLACTKTNLSLTSSVYDGGDLKVKTGLGEAYVRLSIGSFHKYFDLIGGTVTVTMWGGDGETAVRTDRGADIRASDRAAVQACQACFEAYKLGGGK